MLIDLVRDLGGWIWMIVGVALLVLEIAAPGALFLWFGLAGIAVGVLALLVAPPWPVQFILFTGLAALVVFYGRHYLAQAGEAGAAPRLNQRGRRLVGTIVVLSKPIVDGRARVRIDDTTWRVIGPNMPSGTRVRIVHADGPVLSVRNAEDG